MMNMSDQATRLRDEINQPTVAKTLAVISGKGGVGKSNTAINFGIKLREANKKVLLIDLDIGMGNIDILIGQTSKYTLADLFNYSLTFHDIIEIGPKDLHYTAGGNSFNELLILNSINVNYFHEQFKLIESDYDFIIFDIGAGISSTNLSFMLAADECIVVMTPEPPAITDAYSVIKHLTLQKQQVPISLILNRSVNQRHGEKTVNRFKNVVKKFLHREFLHTNILPEDKIVLEAVTRQTPYVILNQHAPISKAMSQIILHYLSDEDKHDWQEEKSSAFSYITKFRKLINK